jgi:Domain of unknown function (DUF4260)
MTAATTTKTTSTPGSTVTSTAGTHEAIAVTAGSAATPWMRGWLRAEGAATFAIGLAAFLWLGPPWYAFALLLLVPDLSMIGYLAGPRIGAITYNLAHDLATGVVVFGLGMATGLVPVAAVGAILVAHSGMDRVAGYGLKAPTSFHDTHLGRIGNGR